MDTLSTTKPHTSRRTFSNSNSRINNGHYINIDGTTEKVYTVDEVFSRLEKNLNDFYGTNYKLE